MGQLIQRWLCCVLTRCCADIDAGCAVLCVDQMGQLMQSGDLSQQVIQVLWERFTLKIPDTTLQESRAALILISMVAGSVMLSTLQQSLQKFFLFLKKKRKPAE